MKKTFLAFQKYKALLILSLIVVLALCVRLYRLDSAPYGALIDEAHFGYLAKSLLLTGQDEHGVSWPIVFKGFGDQKLPGYAYLLVPFVAFFDLSVMTIRLPSAILGASMVVLAYALVRQLRLSQAVALGTAMVVAVSPWTFFLSRIGFESNLALWFWLLGLLGLVTLLREKTEYKWRWLLASMTGLCFAAAWYSYIAYRPVTTGLLLLTALWVWWADKRKFSTKFKSLLLVGGVLALGVAPLFHPSVNQANTARLQQVGLFSDPHQVLVINEYRTFCDVRFPLQVCSLVWNKATVSGQQLVGRFFNTYSPEFLATVGETNEKFLTVKGFGQFVWPIYLLFVLGAVRLIFFKKKSEVEWLVLLGLLLAPLPGIIAGDPQKVRMSTLVPFMLITIAYGLEFIQSWATELQAQGKLERTFTTLGVIALVAVSGVMTTWYFVDYFTVHTSKNDYMYQSYVRDLFVETERLAPNQTIFIKPFFSDPTMFYAFYTNMDPKAYQQQAVLGPLESSGFQHTVEIDKVKVWDTGLLSIACKTVATNTPAVFVTNEQEPEAMALTTLKSENDSLTYVYIYDALLFGKQQVMKCNDIAPAERERIYQEYASSVSPAAI